ncbi:MAG: N-acetylglutamate synthase, partial [Clostridiales bacterium]|nr:N-acetylglutamate synthase [Clostridiales bacterium]
VTNDYGKTRELFHRGIDKAKEQGKVKSRGLKQQRIIGVMMSGHDGRRGYIYHAAVDLTYRNMGIATQLLSHVLAALKSEGIHKVALVVFCDNQLGNAFWQSHGFEARQDLVYRNKSLNDENS